MDLQYLLNNTMRLADSSLEASNHRLWLNFRPEVGYGVVLAIKKTPLMKMSSGEERSFNFKNDE